MTASGGTLVQIKGRTLLLGAPRHDTEQLISVAERSAGRAEAAAARKASIQHFSASTMLAFQPNWHWHLHTRMPCLVAMDESASRFREERFQHPPASA